MPLQDSVASYHNITCVRVLVEFRDTAQSSKNFTGRGRCKMYIYEKQCDVAYFIVKRIYYVFQWTSVLILA